MKAGGEGRGARERPALVLASSSPRRSELLRSLGLEFTVRPVDLDETPAAGEEPREYVLRLAREKAAARVEPGEVVLAADTAVVLDGDLLGKPADAADAERMLGLLAGREHTVLTGVAVHAPGGGGKRAAVEVTRVEMAPLTESEIRWYVATGEPMDKAGAYAVQGLGALLVAAVFGSYTNVVGLPLPMVRRLFAELGYELLDFRA